MTDYDIVLFGATGFTGGLTAEYLAVHAPTDLRWAIAGRNPSKLSERAASLSESFGSTVGTLAVDVTDDQSVRSLASSTRVVATTVGPYMEYGEPLVAACAEAGTDYVDLTGEPEFVDRMWLKYHRRAVETGARLVHSCGFDSIPHDLGVWFTLRHLPTGVPTSIEGFVRADGSFSAGTYHSAVRAFGRARQSSAAAAERKRSEPRSSARQVHSLPGRLRREPGTGRWSVPLPTIDPIVVLRSARSLEAYGPDFSYGHYASVGQLPVALGAIGGAAALFGLAQLPPTRAGLLALKKAGDGPGVAKRSTSWFRVRFVAAAGNTKVVTEVSGGDPGYGETAAMLAQSALCLVLDDLPSSSGQVTTAVAMGDALLTRLQEAGISFRLVSVI